jgi:hypothetical protein
MAKTPPRIEITKHPEFRVIHINGFFGVLNPHEGDIKFYTDIAEPRIKSGGGPGEMELDRISREIQVEIRMSPANWLALAAWMEEHIKRLEKAGALKREPEPKKTQDAYRV